MSAYLLQESLLWAAAQGGNAQDCESLIQYGADVNWKNADGDTPLLAACRRGHAETIELLLACGADSNVGGIDSLTPLHIATRRGDADSVNILLNANTSTTIRTKDGQTALDIARAKGYETIYARLMEKRTGVNRQPPAPSLITTSNSLINNVRNELPSVLVNPRSESAVVTASAESIAPASRQLQSLSRLIQQAKTDYSDRRNGHESSVAAEPTVNSNGSSGSAARRRRHPSTVAASSVSSSIDSTGSGRTAWAGAEADIKSNFENTVRERSVDNDVKEEQSQKELPLNATKPSVLSSSSQKSAHNNNNPNTYSLMNTGSSGANTATQGVNNSVLKNSLSSPATTEDPAIVALRKILDQEKAARKSLEMKVYFFLKTSNICYLFVRFPWSNIPNAHVGFMSTFFIFSTCATAERIQGPKLSTAARVCLSVSAARRGARGIWFVGAPFKSPVGRTGCFGKCYN